MYVAKIIKILENNNIIIYTIQNGYIKETADLEATLVIVYAS
jgi:hypothetical protein